MTTLREAAQQALEALENSRVFVTTREKIKHPEGTEWYDERITALRKALAQEEQEPVAWLKTMYSGTRPMLEVDHLRKATSTPVYTAPPRCEWRGLTDDEISALFPLPLRSDYKPYSFARAVEAALKEKNHD